MNFEEISVLIVGNNPIEMSTLYEQIKSLKKRIAQVGFSFDQKETLSYVRANKPNCIIIDDNYGLSPIKDLMKSLSKFEKSSFALTLLKTHNAPISLFGFQDYLLKDGMTAERLYKSLKNGLRFRRTKAFIAGKLKKK